jgi:phage repressor protein C with HTH and peptisase S24 domain
VAQAQGGGSGWHVDGVDRRSARLGLAVVRGRSMLHTLFDGDRLLVRHLAAASDRRRVSIGRLVVCRPPDRPMSVKRLVGPRDGGWWVERDNPDEGADSWTFGALDDEAIIAVVICRLWPHPSALRRRRPRASAG